VTATVKTLTIALLALAIVACQPGTNAHPVPSVAQIGSDLHCTGGDHGFEDSQAGWGFCYPGTWKYNERSQFQTPATAPAELDLTFDITDIPCESPAPGRGTPSARPICSPNAGLFAFMIVSTFERGGSPSLASWVQANLKPPPTLTPIDWGNATEAAIMSDGRRIALTPNHVVILDLRGGQGNLDLEAQMSKRLGTWKFLY
jgi:hypothetical protein